MNYEKSNHTGTKYNKSEALGQKRDKWDKPSYMRTLILPTFDLSQGLCGQTDPELFFPESTGSGYVYAAKKICEQCPVQRECLEWALKNDERYGIWGGLTARERDSLRRKAPKGRGRPRTYKAIPLRPERR